MVESPLQRELRELEARADRATSGHVRPKAIRLASQRRAAAGGKPLTRSTVSGWFVNGHIPQDFAVLWAYVMVLLEITSDPSRPRNATRDRSWWREQETTWKGWWQAARGTRPPTTTKRTTRQWPLVRDVTLTDFGVHPALRTADADDGDPHPPYVHRDCDGALDQAVTHGGLVIVEGRSGAGKSRAAAESVRRVTADRVLVAPANRQELHELEPVREAVVWLNDLENYCGAGGLDMPTLARLCPPGRSDVVIVATLRSEAWRSLEQLPELGPLAQASFADVFRVATVIRPPLLFSPAERERAGELRSDPRIANWLAGDTDTGLAEYLAAGPPSVARWLAGKAGRHLLGAALVSAAVDCRRANYAMPVPLAVLSDLTRHYLDQRDLHRQGQPSLDDAVLWATTPISGASSCLLPAEGGYRAFDYLVDHRQRDSDAPPVPVAVWRALLSHATGNDLRTIVASVFTGNLDWDTDEPALADLALARYGEVAGFENVWQQVTMIVLTTSRAEPRTWSFGQRYARWLRPFAEAGNPVAMGLFGEQLRDNGEFDEGEQWLRRSAVAGNDDSAAELARVLHEAGRQEELATWLDEVVAVGRGVVVTRFAEQLIAEGQPADAKKWYERAVALGDLDAMVGLGVLYERGKEWDKSEPLLRAAAEAGHPVGMYGLAVLLRPLIGRRREAEKWFRAAADAGVRDAASSLARSLYERGDTEALAEWLERERAIGEFDRVLEFAMRLAREGDMAGAEQWYRHAAELGSRDAVRALGDVRYTLGDMSAARDHYQRAAADGDICAMMALGTMAQPAQAEEWYRAALRDHHVLRSRTDEETAALTLAKFRLARLLEQQEKTEEAEQWYENAADDGDGDAMYNLGLLLSRQGRTADARSWFGRASDQGDAEATAKLWHTYVPGLVRPDTQLLLPPGATKDQES